MAWGLGSFGPWGLWALGPWGQRILLPSPVRPEPRLKPMQQFPKAVMVMTVPARSPASFSTITTTPDGRAQKIGIHHVLIASFRPLSPSRRCQLASCQRIAGGNCSAAIDGWHRLPARHPAGGRREGGPMSHFAAAGEVPPHALFRRGWWKSHPRDVTLTSSPVGAGENGGLVSVILRPHAPMSVRGEGPTAGWYGPDPAAGRLGWAGLCCVM